MKTLNSIAIWTLVVAPVFYVLSYFVFLQSTRPPGVNGIVAFSPSVTIVTGNQPVKTKAVKVFQPALKLHYLALKGDLRIVVHEFG